MYPDLTSPGGQPSPYVANPNPFPTPFNSPFNPMNAMLGAASGGGGEDDAPTGRVAAHKRVYRPEELMQFNDSQGIKTSGGQIPGYPIDKVRGIVKGARLAGVDPYQALALAMQETGIGMDKKSKSALLGTSYDMDDPYLSQAAKLENENPDLNSQYIRLAMTLKQKRAEALDYDFVDPKNEAQILQAYNGYGKVKASSFGKGATKAYGVPIPEGGLDMKKGNYYGKRLVQLKQDMMKQQNWRDLVESIK